MEEDADDGGGDEDEAGDDRGRWIAMGTRRRGSKGP